jgi:thiamine biosynthesis lipoprotein
MATAAISEPDLRLERRAEHWAACYAAMASPCELLLQEEDPASALRLAGLGAAETRRIEWKFSRYRDDNVIHAVNTAGGRPVEVDAETGHLLDLAARAHELSNGRFDITSGVLRRAWTFDGGDRVPSRAAVKALLSLVGWHRVRWTPPVIALPAGMEIDLGGLGKEYAVDRVATLLAGETAAPFLVNFGGDLRVSGPRRDGGAWRVGVEDPGREDRPERLIELRAGALVTSGDARRFVVRRGVRYSHILNPRTGWPVRDAPRSVTVAAGSCTEAGLLSTIAMIYGRGAEAFLAAQDVPHWCRR